jgi:hypothetical protein
MVDLDVQTLPTEPASRVQCPTCGTFEITGLADASPLKVRGHGQAREDDDRQGIPGKAEVSTNSSVDSPCHGPMAAIRSPRLDWSTAP